MRYLIFLLAVLFVVSCIKDDVKLPDEPELVNTEMNNGLPANSESCNGYLYASYFLNQNNAYIFAHSTYRDPGANLISAYNHYVDQELFTSHSEVRGNVRVGDVKFNGNFLGETNSGVGISYRLTNTNNAVLGDGSAHWQTAGNGSFRSLDEHVTRGFPKILYPSTTQTVSISKDYIIEIKNITANFDSLIVSIGNVGSQIRKKAVAGDQFIKFTKEELYSCGLGAENIYFYAFNYSNRTINSKVYVFELSNKFVTILQIIN